MLTLHAEVVAAVCYEHVELFEGAFVQKHVYSFAGRVFSFGVLRVDSFLSAAESGFLAVVDQLLDLFLYIAHIRFVIIIFRFCLRKVQSELPWSIWGEGTRWRVLRLRRAEPCR